MKGGRKRKYVLGVPYDSALARRERVADTYDIDFGQERLFPELVDALIEEVPAGAAVLEVGAATGLMTRPLLEHAGSVTAMEPSAGLLRRLLSSEVAASPRLRTLQGLVEDLPPDVAYHVGVVTFTPRRGRGLLRLVSELAIRVSDRIVMLLREDQSMDWAYLARSLAGQGFDVRLRIVSGSTEEHCGVVLTALVANWRPEPDSEAAWGLDARELQVPSPAPRGTASRLVRYFLAGGDRALLVRTDADAVDRLYGNLRTAVHRIGRNEVTVRRDGDSIQIVRLPRAQDGAPPDEL